MSEPKSYADLVGAAFAACAVGIAIGVYIGLTGAGATREVIDWATDVCLNNGGIQFLRNDDVLCTNGGRFEYTP